MDLRRVGFRSGIAYNNIVFALQSNHFFQGELTLAVWRVIVKAGTLQVPPGGWHRYMIVKEYDGCVEYSIPEKTKRVCVYWLHFSFNSELLIISL